MSSDKELGTWHDDGGSSAEDGPSETPIGDAVNDDGTSDTTPYEQDEDDGVNAFDALFDPDAPVYATEAQIMELRNDLYGVEDELRKAEERYDKRTEKLRLAHNEAVRGFNDLIHAHNAVVDAVDKQGVFNDAATELLTSMVDLDGETQRRIKALEAEVSTIHDTIDAQDNTLDDLIVALEELTDAVKKWHKDDAPKRPFWRRF